MNLHNARKALCLSLALVFGYSATGIAQFVSRAQLTVARRGNTATGLQDGKVVVVGGENAGGTVGAVELFDPATRAFSSLAASVGRTDHTATLLPDGRVLVAGGRDGLDALDSTQIFNPLDNTFSAGPSLQRARSGHSATLLADGRVLLVGGDAAGSAEIFDAAAQLSTLTGSLAEPRALHGAAALKDGRVLIAGGVDAADATQVLDSAVLVSSPPAKITTDLTDYAPGTPVVMTGSGFLPSEQVNISLDERPDAYTDPQFIATADDQGNFTFTGFAPQQVDLNKVFVLTAIGQNSGYVAQTTFHDAGRSEARESPRCTTLTTSFVSGTPVCAHTSGLGGI